MSVTNTLLTALRCVIRIVAVLIFSVFALQNIIVNFDVGHCLTFEHGIQNVTHNETTTISLNLSDQSLDKAGDLRFLDNGHALRNTQHVKMVVFAPISDGFYFSIRNITPSIQLAMDKAKTMLPNWVNLTVNFSDSHYPDEYRSTLDITAIRLIDSQQANVFFGPIGDVLLDRVARVASHENIPIISPLGLHLNFAMNKSNVYDMYKTLVRIGPNCFDLLKWFLEFLINKLKYQKLKIISQKHEASDSNMCKKIHDTIQSHDSPDYKVCGSFHSSLDYLLNYHKNTVLKSFQFDFYLIPKQMNVTHILLKEIGVNFGGELSLKVVIHVEMPKAAPQKSICHFQKLEMILK